MSLVKVIKCKTTQAVLYEDCVNIQKLSTLYFTLTPSVHNWLPAVSAYESTTAYFSLRVYYTFKLPQVISFKL